jgi:hypothetical protein
VRPDSGGDERTLRGDLLQGGRPEMPPQTLLKGKIVQTLFTTTAEARQRQWLDGLHGTGAQLLRKGPRLEGATVLCAACYNGEPQWQWALFEGKPPFGAPEPVVAVEQILEQHNQGLTQKAVGVDKAYRTQASDEIAQLSSGSRPCFRLHEGCQTQRRMQMSQCTITCATRSRI